MEQGGYLDLATTGEVQLVQRLGVDAERCIHTHPIKRAQDIRNALEFGVRTFVADNPDEVRKFARYGRARAPAAAGIVPQSRRGVRSVAQVRLRSGGCLELARLAAALGVDVQGISFHVGSQAADPAKHVEAIEACATTHGRGAPRAARHAAIHWTSAAAFRSTTGAPVPDIGRFCAPIRAAAGEAAQAHPRHRRARPLHRRPRRHRRRQRHGPCAARGPLVVLPG